MERDAFTITWQAKLSPPQVLVESLSDANQDLVGRFAQTGAVVTLLNITMDHGIPTILATLRYLTSEAPALVLSAATHLDPEVAVRKSLEEVELCRRLAQLLKLQMPPLGRTQNYENVVSQHGHLRFFSERENVHLADFLFGSRERVELRDVRSLSQRQPDLDLEILIQHVTRAGHQVFCSDLTTPDIRDLGLSVVRAIIPGFHPLFFGHRCRALGGSRVWEVPRKLGYAGIRPDVGDNTAPHPFP
jgi:ribosomal protein S12 methylthiotransferase accessory factor